MYVKAMQFRSRLIEVIEKYIENGWASSYSDFAVRAGIGHTVLSRILSGDVWPSTAVLAQLEQAVELPLWPHQRSIKSDRRPKGYDKTGQE